MRIVGFIIFGLTTFFYKKVFKSDTNLWLFTIGLSFILLIENLSVAFGQKSNTLEYINYSFIHFKEYFPMMILTALSAAHGYRFLHILVLCLFSIIVSAVDMGISGVF